MVEVVVFHDMAEIQDGKTKKIIWIGTQTFTITHLEDDGKTIATSSHDHQQQQTEKLEENQLQEKNNQIDMKILNLRYNGKFHKKNKAKKTLDNDSSKNLSNETILNDNCDYGNFITELPQTTCEFCLQDFPSLLHKRRHKKMRHFYCLHCDKQYKDADSVKQHPCAAKDTSNKNSGNSNLRQSVTLIKELPQTTCEFCLQDFPSLLHKRRHKKMRHFSFLHCEKEYKSADSLKDTMRRNSGNSNSCQKITNITPTERPFSITIQNVHPKTNSSLISSEKTETYQNQQQQSSVDEKSQRGVKCPVCGKLFRTNYMVKRHSVIHTGEKPYKCEICNRAFTQITGLNRHKREIHHRINECNRTLRAPHQFSCQECGRTFKDVKFLKIHQKTDHSSNFDEKGKDAYIPNEFSDSSTSSLNIQQNREDSQCSENILLPAQNNKDNDNNDDDNDDEDGDDSLPQSQEEIYIESENIYTTDFVREMFTE